MVDSGQEGKETLKGLGVGGLGDERLNEASNELVVDAQEGGSRTESRALRNRSRENHNRIIGPEDTLKVLALTKLRSSCSEAKGRIEGASEAL